MNKKELVIITGASSGIGASIAKLFSQNGYNLGLLARNIKVMEQFQLPNTICIETDVTNNLSVQNAINQIEKQFGVINCLINNAGFVKGGEFTTLTHAEHENTVQVNLLGVINGIEAVLPKMREQKCGTIINISSVADRYTRPNISTYAATKAAVRSLTHSLRIDNAKYGIRFCNVAPAKVNTPMLIKSSLPLEDAISVDELAKAILWIYQQPKTICIRDIEIAPTVYEA